MGSGGSTGQRPSETNDGGVGISGNLKLKELLVSFHPSDIGMGEKPACHATIKTTIEAYAKALATHQDDDNAAWVGLWAEGGKCAWYDPVGAPPHIGKSAIAEQFKNVVPPLSAVVIDHIFYTAHDKMAVASLSITLKDGPTLKANDRFVFTDDYKIKELYVHLHPSDIGMAPKPSVHADIKKFIEDYAKALATHKDDQDKAWLGLWGEADSVAWHDPVGAPPAVGKSAIAAKFKEVVPPLSSVVVDRIFYTADDKMAVADLSITVKDGPTIQANDWFVFS